MKKILMLSTGGTIAGEHTETGLAPVYSGDFLTAGIPEVRELCEVECRDVFQLDGTNIQPEDWVILAEAVYDAQDAYDGIVITHGTDTMAYTACALSYMVRNLQKPVILTGAQLPMIDPNTDGRRNLMDAFRTACSGISGVCIVFHGRIMRGVRCRKIHTREWDAFRSVNAEDIGAVVDGEVMIRHMPPMPEGEPTLDTRLEHRVAQISLLPGTEPELLEAMLTMGCRGIILEAFGCGGIPNQGRSLLPCLKRAQQLGVAVLIATQCGCGPVDLSVYDVNVQAARLDAISAYDMTAEAAAVKLMWVLGHTGDPDEVRRMMATCYAGEMETVSGKTDR